MAVPPPTVGLSEVVDIIGKPDGLHRVKECHN